MYSNYVISDNYSDVRADKDAAVICKGSDSLVGGLIAVESTAFAEGTFVGEENRLCLTMCKILLESGVGKIYVSVVKNDYKAAMELIDDVPNIGGVICDALTMTDQKIALASVLASSEAFKERLLFLGSENVEQALQNARELNSPRCVLTYGKSCYSADNESYLYSAAALMGKIFSESNPTINLNGAQLATIKTTEYMLENDIQKLIKGGVTILENIGGVVECIRAVTTCTHKDSVTDYTMRSVNTTLVIDDVLQSLRLSLKTKLKGYHLLGQPIGSISSQVVVELENKKALGYISDYKVPKVSFDPTDPEVCVVELSFEVAHVLSQIHIKAHVSL